MKPPKKLLTTKYRKAMWAEIEPNLKKILKVLPIKEVYVMGSFSTKKKRPADIDFLVLFKTKSKSPKEKWSFDFVVMPDNEHGKFVFDDVKKWMGQKYGKKNFEITKIV
jgi:predicted nucleotidyltransferase